MEKIEKNNVQLEIAEDTLSDKFFAAIRRKFDVMKTSKKGAETVEMLIGLAIMVGILMFVLPKLSTSISNQGGNTINQIDSLTDITHG